MRSSATEQWADENRNNKVVQLFRSTKITTRSEIKIIQEWIEEGTANVVAILDGIAWILYEHTPCYYLVDSSKIKVA